MIRPFRWDDLETVISIGNAAWRNIYGMYRECYGDELFEILIPDEEHEKGNQIRKHCDSHPDWIFVCEEKGKVIGFVTFVLDFGRKVGEICNNAVDAEYKSKGIGQQMYSAVLEHFKSHGMLYARVATGMDRAHAPARKAYERAGFNISHQDVVYFKKL